VVKINRFIFNNLHDCAIVHLEYKLRAHSNS
jgi:hypothetical protein